MNLEGENNPPGLITLLRHVYPTIPAKHLPRSLRILAERLYDPKFSFLISHLMFAPSANSGADTINSYGSFGRAQRQRLKSTGWASGYSHAKEECAEDDEPDHSPTQA
ncbi:hypothetical protein OG21DRAFT_1490439 [Imleria badia]|nr:hypothetical protein OG21DRAFT_1490439 [Imleria badia]